MKCLVFDIWGDFAHYRKFYATSSPLTFSFPPRTAIAGTIAAIIGIDKEEYLNHFYKNKCKIGLRLLKPVKKTRVSYNLIDTKTAKMMSKITNRTQVTFELLKDCKFRIYFYHEDIDIYNKLREYLIDHKCYYTISLGLSEFIANFNFVGEYGVIEKINEDIIDINSVIPFSDDLKIEFEEGLEYFKDTLPNEMNENREVTEYSSIIFERNCKSIKCDIKDYYEIDGGERFVFL